MQNGEPNVYTALALLRSAYTQMQWNKIQAFLAFNTITAPIVLGGNLGIEVRLVISIAALFVHFAIIVSAIRGSTWQQYWEDKMAEYETLDQGQSNSTTSKIRVTVFSDQEFHRIRGHGLASRRLFGPICLGISVGWLWLTINYGFQYFTR